VEHSFEVARLNVDDVKLEIVFVEEALAERVAGGETVAVWPDEHGRTRFLACQKYHAFLQTVDYDQLRAQINGTILSSQS
jgi:hypothetical protein